MGDNSDDTPISSRHGTGPYAVEAAGLEFRVRDLEQWRAALGGVVGQPGALAAMQHDTQRMARETEETLAGHDSRFHSHDQRLTAVERVTWKIAAMCSLAAGAGGIATTLILHWLGIK